jgi:hypothetical protein
MVIQIGLPLFFHILNIERRDISAQVISCKTGQVVTQKRNIDIIVINNST